MKAMRLHAVNDFRLDEIEKIREEGKRPYQTWALALLFAAIAFAVVMGLCFVLGRLGLI